MLIGGVLVISLLVLVRAESLVDVNLYSLYGIQSEVETYLEGLVYEEFKAVNGSVLDLEKKYQRCSQQIEHRLIEECVTCITEKCENKITRDCTSPGAPPSEESRHLPIEKKLLACVVSPRGCLLIDIGKQTVQLVKDNLKKLGSKVKNIIDKILPRIRLPRIRLPRIRLPRIRLPRIRLPRIRLPRIRLPRIRLPRIRLPRIRLPRIRLPRIRVPRIRFPRIRLGRSWGRRKRQTGEPTCEQLLADPQQACSFYQSTCDSCSEFTVTNQTQLIQDICGSQAVSVYNSLLSQQTILEKLGPLLDVTNPSVFHITSVKYDPSTYNTGAAGYDKVQLNYIVLGKSYTLDSLEPLNPNNPSTASKPLASYVFDFIKKTLL